MPNLKYGSVFGGQVNKTIANATLLIHSSRNDLPTTKDAR